MSEINCDSCSNIMENAPDFAINGVTDDVAASLEANTGLNPNLGVLHTNCEDLNDANDCLIGMLSKEIEGADQCDWKEFMTTLLGNTYEMLKAMIASDCGAWQAVDNVQEEMDELIRNAYSYIQVRGSADSESSGLSHTKVTLNTVDISNDPDNIFSFSDGGVKIAQAGVYRVSGSVYVLPTADTRAVGCYIYTGTNYASSAEVTGGLYGVGEGSMSRPVYGGAKLVSLNANDIVFMCSRTTSDIGTHSPSNVSTYLLIEKIQ